MKFIIVAHPRSGTHLLGTLLNSHPELKCYDELLIPRPQPTVLPYKRIKSLDEIRDGEGFIAMYKHIIMLTEKIKGFKVIHLVRDLRETAISYWMDHHQATLGIKPHYYRGQKPEIAEPEIAEGSIRRRIKIISRRRKLAMPYLEKCQILELNYEYLCQNKSVSSLSKEKARSICEFLGVKPMKLTTPLVKSRKSAS